MSADNSILSILDSVNTLETIKNDVSIQKATMQMPGRQYMCNVYTKFHWGANGKNISFEKARKSYGNALRDVDESNLDGMHSELKDNQYNKIDQNLELEETHISLTQSKITVQESTRAQPSASKSNEKRKTDDSGKKKDPKKRKVAPGHETKTNSTKEKPLSPSKQHSKSKIVSSKSLSKGKPSKHHSTSVKHDDKRKSLAKIHSRKRSNARTQTQTTAKSDIGIQTMLPANESAAQTIFKLKDEISRYHLYQEVITRIHNEQLLKMRNLSTFAGSTQGSLANPTTITNLIHSNVVFQQTNVQHQPMNHMELPQILIDSSCQWTKELLRLYSLTKTNN